jgi:peptidylprolyl isomerase
MVQRIAMGVAAAALLVTSVGAYQAKQAPAAKSAAAPAKAPAGPVVVVETGKGNFEFETYSDAPKSLAHVMDLIKSRFYQGHRVHWAQSNALGFGDPYSKDMTKKDLWGSGGSSRPVGVAETSKRKFEKGTVLLYYRTNYPATTADSQLMILKLANPTIEGKYAPIGKVISGMDVVEKLAVGDVIRKVSVKP